MQNIWKAILPLAAGGLIFLLPTPGGLDTNAWRYFALFVAVITGLIIEPFPAAAVGLMGISLGTALNLVPATPGKTPVAADAVRWALSGFSNGTVWLIFAAFMFALGYEKTGLGKRLGLTLIRRMGRKTLGLGYAVALADLILAPFMPSNTARSGGTIFPIIKNIPPLYGSTPENNPRGLGAYIMWTALATTCVTSSMFLTGLAPNVLAQSLVEKTAHVQLGWTQWFVSFLPAGAILFLATPLIAYLIYPPTQKTSENAPVWAAEELAKLGPVTRGEMTMAALAVAALSGWIFLGKVMDGTTVALAAVCVMALARVVTWEDIIGYKQAWNVLAWFATLVTMADGLNKTGFLKWFAQYAAGCMQGFSPTATMIGLVLLFFVSHYMFASITAHVAALLPVMLATAMAVPELNMQIVSMLLCATLGIMGIISPYGTGPSPLYYGSGYIKGKEFWVLGLVFGAIYLGVFLLIGFPWIVYRG